MMGRKKKSAARNQKLYVFFWHGGSGYNVHSLYALDIPGPDVEIPIPMNIITTTVRTVVGSTTIGTPKETVVTRCAEPERVHIDPVVGFVNGKWPQIMTCARLNSRLYFLGGYTGDIRNKNQEYPSKVYTLELPYCPPAGAQGRHGVDALDAVKSVVSPMLSGKIAPISFVADGMIFVLSGQKQCRFTGVELGQFEIYSPKDDRWKKGKAPPFTKARLSNYVVVGRNVIIRIIEGNAFSIYSYNLDKDSWSPFDTRGWTKPEPCYRFIFSRGSQFVGGAVYTTYDSDKMTRPVVIRLKHLDNFSDNEEDLLLKDDEFFDVLKYRIHSEGQTTTLARAGDNRLCFVEAGTVRLHESVGCAISVSQFSVGVSAKYLNSAHYVTPNSASFKVIAAYMG